MRGGSWRDAEQIGNYRVEVFEADTDTLAIYIWDKVKQCMSVTLDRNDGVAVIQNVQHSPGCTVMGTMKRGEGTRAMIEFMLGLLKENGAVEVHLQDESEIVCDGIPIDLSVFSIVRRGKTWYEHHFGFQPASEKHARSYERFKAHIQTGSDMSKLPCSTFTAAFLGATLTSKEYYLFKTMAWVKRFN